MSESYYYLNGRVNAMPNFNNNYQIQKQTQKVTETPQNVMSRNYEGSKVSDIFFSTQNIDLLQQGIRNRILNESRGKYNIGRQSDDELKIIMRSIYFQYSQNNMYDIAGQVKLLNTKVLEWSVPQIMTNLKQNEKFIYDISTLPEPLERSQLPSQKGTKTLELKSFI